MCRGHKFSCCIMGITEDSLFSTKAVITGTAVVAAVPVKLSNVEWQFTIFTCIMCSSQ